ncbi:hypothetical protein LQZ18_12785 [Lachnospiraceae bacterium ZAX-1]
MELISWEVVKAYEQSDSYRALQLKIHEDMKRIIAYVCKYLSMETQLKEQTKQKVVKCNYGIGGADLHRGILCPGNMAAFLCGNVTRDRIAKTSKNPCYIYGYDENGTLLSCYMKDEKRIEYIIWETKDIEIGLIYGLYGGIEEISETRYGENGKISSYLRGSVMIKDNAEIEVDFNDVEEYEYFDREIEVLWMHGNSENLNGSHVVLYLDEDGVVTRYTYCDDMWKDEIWEYKPPYQLKLKKN